MNREVNERVRDLEIDQLKMVIRHLNVALARCYTVLAELQFRDDGVQDEFDQELLH